MKRGNLIIFIIVPSVLLIIFFSYQYLIKVYESTVEVKPKNLFADNQSTITISVVPLNGLGWEALFRTSSAEFNVVEGVSLVEVILLDNEKGKLILKAKSEAGKVVVEIKSRHSLLPMLVEIYVQPNLV